VRVAGPGALALVAACSGCASSPGVDPQVPRYEPTDQTSAHVAKSATRPLILEWPAADRASLESRRAAGVVVVRYGGHEMAVLRGCHVAAAYRYVSLTPKEEDVVMRNASELDAAMPIHAVSLEARLEQKQKLEVTMTIVGLYEAGSHPWRAADLQGDCAGATHVIESLVVGAFELAASAETDVGGGVKVLGAGASAHHDAQREVLDRDGSKQACASTGSGDAAPPHECGALLRVEVAPIEFPAGVAGASPAVGRGGCGPGLVRKGDACVAVDPDRPALLDVLQGGKN
jgi:hypothetical protein